uniref:Uncharacterized protein n=1 Tax=Rhizophora mucronata TaxID=61149 RepID=A0A2P2J091_RHIMU
MYKSTLRINPELQNLALSTEKSLEAQSFLKKFATNSPNEMTSKV